MDTGFLIMITTLVVFVVLAILFTLTQFKTLRAIRPGSRLMRPSSVWYQLIPLFGFFWQFTVVIRIAGSLQQELRYRAEDDSVLGVADVELLASAGGKQKPTLQIGIWYCSLFVSGIVLNSFGAGIARMASVLSLGGTICWIIYWVRLAGFKRKLKSSPI